MRHPLASAVLEATALILLSMLAPGRAAAAEIGFSLNEAQIIVDFYGDGPPVKCKGKGVGNQGMPPGLAKQANCRQALPSAGCRPIWSRSCRRRPRASNGSSSTTTSCWSISQPKSSTTL